MRLLVATLFAALVCALGATPAHAAKLPLDLWEYEDSLLTFHGDAYGSPGESTPGVGVGLVTDAGCDVTGDGIDDTIVGAPTAKVAGVADVGRVYVIPGGARAAGGYSLPADVSDPPPAGAIAIEGAVAGAGTSVACAGDVNGDGQGDLLIGEYGGSANGEGISAYVIFGGDELPAAGFSLGSLGAHGYRITDTTGAMWIGQYVAAAGDVDGDGKDDVALGDSYAMHVSVVAGKAETDTIELVSDTDATLLKVVGADDLGVVAGVGDVDGDDVPDLLVGSPFHQGSDGNASGAAYAVSGAARGAVDVADWEAADSGVLFPIWGPLGRPGGIDAARAGSVVAPAGDVDGDGLADLAIGQRSWQVDAADLFHRSVWIVYGKTDGAAVDLDALGADGYVIDGEHLPNAADAFGEAIAPLGDVDGDGSDDLAVGAPRAGDFDEDLAYAGAAYVVYGQTERDVVAMATLTCADGARLDGRAPDNQLGATIAGTTGFAGVAGQRELIVGALAGGGTAGFYLTAVPLADRPGACVEGPEGAVTFGSGWLDWGVKQSFRNYIVGPIAQGSYAATDGASRNPDGTFRFDVLGGRYDPADGSGELLIDGTVAFHGHHGQLQLTIRNLRVELAGAQGTLYADVSSRSLADGQVRQYLGVALAELVAPASGPSGIPGGFDFGSLPATLTVAGAPPFGDFYTAGTQLDPLAVTALLGTPRGRPDRRTIDPPPGGGDSRPTPAKPTPSPKRPTVGKSRGRIAVGRGGRATLATLRCGGERCKVVVRKSIEIKVKRKRYRAQVLAPKALKPGATGKLRLRLSKAARRALVGRSAKVRLTVTIATAGGKTKKTVKTTLVGPARKAVRVP